MTKWHWQLSFTDSKGVVEGCVEAQNTVDALNQALQSDYDGDTLCVRFGIPTDIITALGGDMIRNGVAVSGTTRMVVCAATDNLAQVADDLRLLYRGVPTPQKMTDLEHELCRTLGEAPALVDMFRELRDIEDLHPLYYDRGRIRVTRKTQMISRASERLALSNQHASAVVGYFIKHKQRAQDLPTINKTSEGWGVLLRSEIIADFRGETAYARAQQYILGLRALPFLHEALAYEANAFAADEEINGGDLLEWFAEWRQRAAAAMQ